MAFLSYPDIYILCVIEKEKSCPMCFMEQQRSFVLNVTSERKEAVQTERSVPLLQRKNVAADFKQLLRYENLSSRFDPSLIL